VQTVGVLGAIGVVVAGVAAVSLLVGMGIAGATAALWMWSASREVEVVVPDRDPLAADPGVPQFERVGSHERQTPIEIPGAAPPVDAEPAPRTVSSSADLTLGVGRVAVLELGMAPQALNVPGVVEVTAAPPYLVVTGISAGHGTLTVEFKDGGSREWTLDVLKDPSVDAVGGPSLVASSGERLRLPVGAAAVCTLERTPKMAVVLDKDSGRLEEMGERGFFLQADDAIFDVVFATDGRPPEVITVEGMRGEPGPDGAGPVPEGCVVPPAEIVKIPVGGELMLPVDNPISTLLVGDSDRFEALRVDGDSRKIRVRALRKGQTTVAATNALGGDAWVRRVVSE
jgi:hypothetical protein